MNTRWNFSAPRTQGQVSRQAHADIPSGSYEREIGRDGFYGPSSHIYHRNPPTAWSSASGPARPRAFEPLAQLGQATSPWDSLELFRNGSTRIRIGRIGRSMDHLARNADGDDLLFIHHGRADFFCDFGHLELRESDYVVIPRGTLWRVETTGIEFLLIEASNAAYALPDRGLLGHHAPFDLGVMDVPELDDAFLNQDRHGHWPVRVKRGGKLGRIEYPFNPLDAMGWKGDLYPVRLNMRDIRAISSDRLHLPPSIRSTFVSDRFIVCSIVPRPMETDPGAMKLPFFHDNTDYDEVIFQHRGIHASRGGAVGPGSLTFHPCGITHGPHPQALPHMFDFPAQRTETYAVMIDARDALEVAELPLGCEIIEYGESWLRSVDLAVDARPETEIGAT